VPARHNGSNDTQRSNFHVTPNFINVTGTAKKTDSARADQIIDSEFDGASAPAREKSQSAKPVAKRAVRRVAEPF
jgi:hypothetical protein